MYCISQSHSGTIQPTSALPGTFWGDSCLHLVVHIYMAQKIQHKSPQKPPHYPHNASREAKSLETRLQKVAEFAAISSIMLISPNLVQ